MSQKSILSFFKTSQHPSASGENKQKTSENSISSESQKSKCAVVGKSPVKKPRKKRKIKCIENDEESTDISNKHLNGDNKSDDLCEEETNSSGSKLKKVSSEEDEKKINGILHSKKPSKQKKIENDEENENGSSEYSEKIERSDLNHNEASSVSNAVGTEEEPSASDQNNSVQFIPKRKTARKQMNSTKNTRKEIQNKFESKTAEDSVTSENMSNCITTCDNVKLNYEINSNTIIQSNSEKYLESEKSKDIKEVPDLKRKVNISSKINDSPLKKSARKESVLSFFTPLKKSEDRAKNENILEKDKTSQHDENDDSPVKNIKQKKKTQVLESDSEEETALPKSPVKMEVENNGSKSNSTSPKKNEDEIEKGKSPDSAVKAKASLCQKPVNENSKVIEEKQQLGLKSTSASGTVYDPSKYNYHPINDACWKRNEKVPYLALAKTLELIENTSGRLRIIEILSNFFRSVIVLSPNDMLHSVYLCLNRLAPEYEGIELGIGETLLMKAVAQATGRTLEKIKAEVAVKGDLGLVSESSRGNQRVMFAPPKLTVSSVFNKFLEIAKMSGNAAMTKKTDKIQSLFVACRDCEAKYIIRSLSGKLRIGLAEQSVLSAIARAAVLTPPGQTYPPEKIDASKGMSSDSIKGLLDSQILILKTAYCECPNYDLIIPVLLEKGIAALPSYCQLCPGRPLKPMLAHPTAGIDKVLERFDKNAFTCEFKYDGERAQIHMTEKGDVKIFSRNQEDNTSKYPDVISRISKALKESTKSFILDSEAVAWDKETRQILPFQVLSTRKKKDAIESEIVVQVCIMAFDLLYLNGESLIKKPLKERRSLLHSSFIEVKNEFVFAEYKDGDNAETMQEFLDEAVKGNCEGLMVKALEIDASYEIAKRSHNWLKLKKDYLQGIGDTLDLVVIGGYYGKGKRTGNYGGFLLACYDGENEEFQSICKLGTGFKDDSLEAHTTFLKQHVINKPKSYFRYDHSLEPDDWFEPVQVWEIKCADLSISPVHKAAIGIVDREKGISLRFPRFIRIRDDKSPENATNSVQIAEMYQNQQQIQNTVNKNAKVEEDYY